MSRTVSSDRETASKRQPSLAVPAQKTERLKRIALSLSIANICFLYVWSGILHVATDRRFFYVLGSRPDRAFFWALLFDVVILGGFLFCLLLLRESHIRWTRSFADGVLALICAFAVYQLYHETQTWLSAELGSKGAWIVRIAAVCLLVLFATRARKRSLSGLGTFFLVLSPLCLVLTLDGLWAYYGTLSKPSTPPRLAPMLPPGASQSRVIWIIFDELDNRLLFDARPTRVHLPNFDALRRTSLYGDHAKSPAHDTLTAIPSLLLSKTIPAYEDVNVDVRPVEVRFSGCSKFVSLLSQQNIFQRARKLGLNTAVSGWYHPYCRLFGSDLSACSTAPGAGVTLVIPQQLLQHRPFLEKAAYLANWQARSLPLASRLRWITPMPDQPLYAREAHIGKNELVMQSSMKMLRNRDLQFVFIHLPVPHPPGIWNAKTKSFSTDARLNYLDNLELADYRLGQIRELLQQTGNWDRSTILVSADHPYRPKNWLTGLYSHELSEPGLSEMKRDTRLQWQPYIPFFLKLRSQRTGVQYDREFNTVLSGDLLLAALQGQIRTPEQAVQWLDNRAATSEQNVCR